MSGNSLALLVKQADLADNTNLERTSQLDPVTRQWLAEKYRRTRALLGLLQQPVP